MVIPGHTTSESAADAGGSEVSHRSAAGVALALLLTQLASDGASWA